MSVKLLDLALQWIPEGDRYGQEIYDAIRQGMAPFKIHHFDVMLDYDIDYHKYRVIADVYLMSQFRIAHIEEVGAEKLADDIEAEMRRLANKFHYAFRNRVDWPLTSNIELGEN